MGSLFLVTDAVLQRLLILAIRETENKVVFLPTDTQLTLTQDATGSTPTP